MLAAAIGLLQYPLWLGEGGWLKVREHAQKIKSQQALNQSQQIRNAGLLADMGRLVDVGAALDQLERKRRASPLDHFVRERTLRRGPGSRAPWQMKTGRSSRVASSGSQPSTVGMKPLIARIPAGDGRPGPRPVA